MTKFRIMINNTGTKYRIQHRFLGCLWWVYAISSWTDNPFEFNTPEDAQDMINRWKRIEDKWEVYHHD